MGIPGSKLSPPPDNPKCIGLTLWIRNGSGLSLINKWSSLINSSSDSPFQPRILVTIIDSRESSSHIQLEVGTRDRLTDLDRPREYQHALPKSHQTKHHSVSFPLPPSRSVHEALPSRDSPDVTDNKWRALTAHRHTL
jgi:hypothetical protein